MMTCSASGTNVRLICDRCKREADRLLRYDTDKRRRYWLCPECEREMRQPSVPMEMTVLGRNLQNLLALRGLSQAEFARRLDVSRSCVHNWCWGINQPGIDTMQTMLSVLDCEWKDLLG